MTMKNIDITKKKTKYTYIWNELESNYDEKSKDYWQLQWQKSIGYEWKKMA